MLWRFFSPGMFRDHPRDLVRGDGTKTNSAWAGSGRNIIYSTPHGANQISEKLEQPNII